MLSATKPIGMLFYPRVSVCVLVYASPSPHSFYAVYLYFHKDEDEVEKIA